MKFRCCSAVLWSAVGGLLLATACGGSGTVKEGDALSDVRLLKSDAGGETTPRPGDVLETLQPDLATDAIVPADIAGDGPAELPAPGDSVGDAPAAGDTDCCAEEVQPSTCGNGTCQAWETCATCPLDCGNCPPACGNGLCDGVEDCSTCPLDCGACPRSCGNDACDAGETCGTCPPDCGPCPPACGNGTCDGAETCDACPLDCGDCPPSCSNGACDAGETCTTCPQDCGECPPSCGNGKCDGTEHCTTCPQDCGECPPSCGNGKCDGSETCSSCPLDCGQCPPSCGNGKCDGSETCTSCPKDCGECPPACGNGKCDGTETCATCAQDCGTCPPPTDPPGGRKNFVVALGKLNSGEKNNDWVRIGTYVFDPAKKSVGAAMWKYAQDNPTHRQHSGSTPNATCSEGKNQVRACEILMLSGFKDASNDNRQGTYKIQTDPGTNKPFVHIDWTPDWYEEWWLPTSGAESYAVLQFKGSDKATVAFAYGSNASLSERRAYSTVVKETGLIFEKWIRKQACADCTYAQVSKDKNATSHFTKWTVCGDGLTWVMTYWDPESSDACGGSADSSIQFYMFRPKSDSRRDGWWFWHTCKTESGAWNECYGCDKSDSHGGSHIYGLMQVLDDSGNYVGHIGVEAGFDEGTCSNPTEYRYSDVLGVVRLTPETTYLNNPPVMP